MNREYREKEIFPVILIVIIFTLLFNSKGYINWAINLNSVIFKEFFLNILRPIDKIAEILYFDSIYTKSRELFLNLFLKQEKKKDISIINKKEDMENIEEKNYSIKNPLKIIMIGDSMIKEAISMAFLKLTKDNKELNTTVSAFYSSGLTRVDSFDWFKQLDLDFVDRYDLAIVMLGMNDAQDMIENNKRVVLFTDQWNSIYRDRLKRFIEKINSNVKKIIWIGLPVMRDKNYNKRMSKLNSLIEEECSKYDNIFFIDSNKILYNNGEYKEYIKIKERLVQVRVYDGKHFTKEGAMLVVEEGIKIIYNTFRFESIANIKTTRESDLIY